MRQAMSIAAGMTTIIEVWKNRLGWWYRTDCVHGHEEWTSSEPTVGEEVFCSECAKRSK